ncbi:hypothetical protein ACIBCT_01900 [Streptosporangium sp. NPDC050855]|uniref:hypothetical protein n=1 Tax=Streptosporangium sp. NPDC050855 TaxID=3366194 RepID=UPI0037ABF2E3
MTRLHDALDDIAREAPLVDLADRVITGHRSRRRTGLAAVAAAVVALGMATAVVTPPGERGNGTVASRGTDTLPDLPDGRVGPLSHAYLTECEVRQGEGGLDCDAAEWRVVTRSGTTYRVPQALAVTADRRRVPTAISRDGRMFAYYSRRAQAHVVRDLVSGSEVVSPVTVKEGRIGVGSMLVVSDDGRYVIFDPREGTKKPGLLIDVRTGRTVSIPGVYEPVGVKDGVAALVRYRKTDLWQMPVTGGGTPVRFDGAFIMFSELAPDGRTVAAFEHADLMKRTLTLLDTGTGRTLRKVAIRGLPEDGSVTDTALWRNESEITIVYGKGEISTYAVDVRTGQARRLVRYRATFPSVILPGVAGIP